MVPDVIEPGSFRFRCYEPVMWVDLWLPPCQMLLALYDVGRFRVTTFQG